MSCQNITSECAPVEVESVVMLGIVEKEVEEICKPLIEFPFRSILTNVVIENGRPNNSGA